MVSKHTHPIFLETGFYVLIQKTSFYKNSMDPNGALATSLFSLMPKENYSLQKSGPKPHY
jgi:hypothetical protein